MKTTLKFALADIKKGRKALRKIVCDHKRKIPITLKGHIVGDWSADDGVSVEFQVDVKSHKLGRPVKQSCKCVRCQSRAA